MYGMLRGNVLLLNCICSWCDMVCRRKVDAALLLLLLCRNGKEKILKRWIWHLCEYFMLLV